MCWVGLVFLIITTRLLKIPLMSLPLKLIVSLALILNKKLFCVSLVEWKLAVMCEILCQKLYILCSSNNNAYIFRSRQIKIDIIHDIQLHG